MQTYLANSAVTLVARLEDESGNLYSPTAVSYRVIDQDGVELVAKTAIAGFVTGQESVSVTIAAQHNNIAVTRAIRTVEFYLTLTTGEVLLVDNYIVEKSDQLIVPTNSFVTYGQAILSASQMVNMIGWDAATKESKTAALVQARLDLGRLRYRYDFDSQSTEPLHGVNDILMLTDTEYAALPTEFKSALGRAQILQANHLLGGSPVEDKRSSGLMSETIGESSQMFRPGKPLKKPVCRAALEALSKYINNEVRIGRC